MGIKRRLLKGHLDVRRHGRTLVCRIELFKCARTERSVARERAHACPGENQKDLASVQQNFGGSRVEEHFVKEKVRSVAVAGRSINEAIDAAYKVLVDDEPRQMTFASDDDMWGVFVAERSFLIRSVSYREYHEWKSPRKRKEFMVNCSAYIGEADGLAEEECAPVTLAVIPLGKPGDATSVGLSFACQTICCRQIGEEVGLLDVQLRNSLHHSAIAGRIRGPAGFRVAGENAAGE